MEKHVLEHELYHEHGHERLNKATSAIIQYIYIKQCFIEYIKAYLRA